MEMLKLNFSKESRIYSETQADFKRDYKNSKNYIKVFLEEEYDCFSDAKIEIKRIKKSSHKHGEFIDFCLEEFFAIVSSKEVDYAQGFIFTVHHENTDGSLTVNCFKF